MIELKAYLLTGDELLGKLREATGVQDLELLHNISGNYFAARYKHNYYNASVVENIMAKSLGVTSCEQFVVSGNPLFVVTKE
jgi:hypothetical protein